MPARTSPLAFTSGAQLAKQLAHTLNRDVHVRAKSKDGTARGKWRLTDRTYRGESVIWLSVEGDPAEYKISTSRHAPQSIDIRDLCHIMYGAIQESD